VSTGAWDYAGRLRPRNLVAERAACQLAHWGQADTVRQLPPLMALVRPAESATDHPSEGMNHSIG